MAIIYRLVKGEALTHAELDNNFRELADQIAAVASPSSPTGVAFSTAPGTPTVTNTGITETASVVDNNGTPVNIPSLLMPYTLAASGKKRRDAIVVDYLAGSPTYVRIAGTEVNSTDVVPTPSIPVNRLFVRYLDITDGAATAYQSELSAVTAALAGKMDKSPTVVTDWLAYTSSGKVEGVGPNGEYVHGDAITHLGGKTNTSYDVTSHVAPYQQYTRYIQRTNALVVEVDTGWVAKADKDLSINTQTASYTLSLTDRGNMVRMNVASANTLTVPPNSAVAFPVGTQIVLAQAGAGQTTVVAGSGVTINASGAKMKLTGQYSGATLVQVSANVWLLMGDLSA